jgi:microcystin-dependent protein
MGEALIVRRGGAVGEAELFIEPGLIVEFFGLSSNIPEGWELCDGSNDTPNLVDKFIVGAGDTYTIGNTGGFADAIVPTHNHISSATNTTGNHSHFWIASGYGLAQNDTGRVFLPASTQTNIRTMSFSGDHTHSSTISTVGESGIDKNLPPYVGLFYIIKVEE